MKNIRGFALLEIFAVIALLSLVIAIAIPQIISANKEAKEKAFKEAVIETFTQALTNLDQDIELSKKAGEWNCSNYKHNNKKLFSSCKIVWTEKDPTIINLKISVVSNVNEKWSYLNQTKALIEAGSIYNY